MKEQSKNQPSLSSEELEALYTHAYRLYNVANYAEAESLFRFLTMAEGLNKRSWMGLAATQHMQGDYTKAIDHYSFAATLDPSKPLPHLHAAECLLALDDKERAQQALYSAEILAKKEESYKTLLSRIQTLKGEIKCLA